MISYRVEETINRPIRDVFPYVGDPNRHAEWMDVSDVKVVTPGEVRVGTTVQEMMKVRSRLVPFSWQVTAYQPDAHMTFRTIVGPMNWEGGFEVSPADGVGNGARTRVTSSGTVGLKGWQRLLQPFVGGEVRRGEAAELRRLKALLERPA